MNIKFETADIWSKLTHKEKKLSVTWNKQLLSTGLLNYKAYKTALQFPKSQDQKRH